MSWRWLFLTLIILGTCASASSVVAQEITETEFEEVVEELEYDKTRRALRLRDKFIPKFEEQEELDVPETGLFSKVLLELLAYALVLVLIGIIIYMIFSNVNIDKKLEQVESDFEEIEDLDDIDAASAYAAALAAGDYRLALRMQFIKLLQLLSEKEKIVWEKEKTNRDYYRELSPSEIKQRFRNLATIYERVWYGNQTLDKVAFTEYDRRFISFHNQVA